MSCPSVPAGVKKLTNKAVLWYVPCSLKNVDKILDVPPIKVARGLKCVCILGWVMLLTIMHRTAVLGTTEVVCWSRDWSI